MLRFAGALLAAQVDAAVLGVRDAASAAQARPAAALQALLERAGPCFIKLAQVGGCVCMCVCVCGGGGMHGKTRVQSELQGRWQGGGY